MFMKDRYHPFISWTDSFIYVDGRFRFAGSGAHPFWEGAPTRAADASAQPSDPSGGKLDSSK